jgi:hypothetical protein
MVEIVRCYDFVYSTKYAYYKYKDNTQDNAKKFAAAVSGMQSYLKIDHQRTWVLFKPIPFNKWSAVHTYGLMESRGNIVLDPRFSYDRLLATLSHEMWHVRQWHRGDLRYTRDSNGTVSGILWKGKYYPHIFPITTDRWDEYQAEPWEVEARQHEKLLLDVAMTSVDKFLNKTA